MLVAMNKVDKELIDELRAHFRRLDVDGKGELSKASLVAIARKKLKSPARKLELALYKKNLLTKQHPSTEDAAKLQVQS